MTVDLYEIQAGTDEYEDDDHAVWYPASYRAYRGTSTCVVCGGNLTGTWGYGSDDDTKDAHERCVTVHLIPSL